MVSLNNHSNKDYVCDYIHKEIQSPELKRSTVEIPLRDGVIDVTKFLTSTPFYGNRQIVVDWELRAIREDWPYYHMAIMRDLHGQEVELVFDEDPEYAWIGVASVGMLQDHGATAGIRITVDAQPFKRRRNSETIFTETVSGDKNVTFQVSDMRAYPSFTASAAGMTVTYDGETYTLPVGTSNIYGLYFTEGSHTLALHGSGTIGMTYRGGML